MRTVGTTLPPGAPEGLGPGVPIRPAGGGNPNPVAGKAPPAQPGTGLAIRRQRVRQARTQPVGTILPPRGRHMAVGKNLQKAAKKAAKAVVSPITGLFKGKKKGGSTKRSAAAKKAAKTRAAARSTKKGTKAKKSGAK